MQIVIELSNGDFREVQKDTYSGTPFENRVFSAIANGTVLTESICDSCGKKNSIEYLIHPKMRICSDCSYKIHNCGFVQVKGEQR